MKLINCAFLGGWLWVTTHVQKVVGSNPGAMYWMDFFHIDLL